MKKLYLFLYYLIFTIIIVALFWAVNQNLKEPMNQTKKHSTAEQTVKKPKQSKPKKEQPKKEKIPLSKEQKAIAKAKKEPLSKRFKSTKSKWGDKIFIRIFKKESELEIWIKAKNSTKYKLLKVYNICSYSGRLGPKLKEGDMQAPEGFYKVYKHSLNPHSNYHLSFNLGFPNAYDKANKRTGSYLMVHGKCVSAGCYAMGDKNIEQIYKLTKKALYNNEKYIPVHIFPFRMSKENLIKYKTSKWYNFWQNLKEGYDLFEKYKIPPKVYVKAKKYKFSKPRKKSN